MSIFHQHRSIEQLTKAPSMVGAMVITRQLQVLVVIFRGGNWALE